MRKIKLLLLFVLLFTINQIVAQKAKIKNQDVSVSYERPDYLKTIKTYNYTIQDDGEYWNFILNEKNYPEDNYPNLTSLTEGVTINGLEKVSNDSDLNIIVGFIGNQLKINNALIEMKGTINIMFFLKDKLINSVSENVNLKGVVSNKFPVRSKADRNTTKAKLVTNYVQKIINNQGYLFNDNIKERMPLGMFKKAKGVSEAFNIKTESLINEVIANPSDLTILDKANKYWKEQLDVDFGKKVKDKAKYKVIYVNLIAVSILKNDIETAKEYLNTVGEYTGLFDGWKANFKKILKNKETLNGLKDKTLTKVNITSNTAYYITIDESGTYTYKNKEIKFSKIEIARFIPSKKSGIASLDSKKKPNIYIYENGKKSLRYFGDEKHKIVTDSGKEIIFKENKSEFKPYIKTKSGDYELYYGK